MEVDYQGPVSPSTEAAAPEAASPAPEHDDSPLSVREAAREVTRKRKEAGDGEDHPVEEIKYQDGSKEAKTIKQAASDLSDYRKSKAQALLAEMTGEPAAEATETPEAAPEAETLPELTPEERAHDAERQKVAQERQEFEIARRTYQHAVTSIVAQAIGVNAEQYSDIRSEADLQRMAIHDPQRFARWQQTQDQLMAAQKQLLNLRRAATPCGPDFQKFAENKTECSRVYVANQKAPLALTAEAAETDCRLPGTATIGVSPLTPQVRPCTASARKPDLSQK